MNLAENLVRTALVRPTDAALLMGDTTITYEGLLQRARDVAGTLHRHGIRPGDRVGLVSPNTPAFPAAFYGALLAGCAVVPMNPMLTGHEIDFYLDDSGARAVLADVSVVGAARDSADRRGLPTVVLDERGQVPERDLLASAEERDGDDLAVVLYTSGTTGRPKGAMLTHANLNSNALTTAETLTRTGPGDVVMGCLPLFHVFGLTCGLNAAVLSGAALALLPRFDPQEALRIIARHGVTVFEGVPTMYAAMKQVPDATAHDTSSLRTCLSGGAAMPVELMHGFEETFGCRVLEGYGLSETSPVVSFNQPERERRPGSVGLPVRGVEVRLVDDAGADVAAGSVGEVAVRGECLMAGYLGRPDATAEAVPDGWFRTGDLARTDEDGYLYIVDRKKQLIIRGGYNVYPREVEEALYQHPAVAEAAVVGLAHSTLGEEIGAAVAATPGHEIDIDELRAFCRERVAAYKYPRHIWVVDALPKGPTGKILHREVEVPAHVVVER